jgi:hypothetical protein
MSQDIAVGMTGRSSVKRNFDAAQDKFAAGNEPVQVIADSGTAHRMPTA